MHQTLDRGGEGSDVGAAFADPAFAGLKMRGAPFAILRPDSGAVLWANAAAAKHWGVGDAAALSGILFGVAGRGGWLDGLARGLVPGRPPCLARAGLARGFGMRAHTALLHAWTAPDGTPLIGLAVPDAAAEVATDPEAWRRPAWGAEPAAPDPGSPDGETPGSGADGGDPGPTLARRGQLAVLRDRLSRAIDGAATLRFLWRTDAEGAIASIDAATFARLGAPLRFDAAALPDAVAEFDSEGGARLRSALATRATWAGITVDLPVADAAATVPMALSGSPVLGPERAFAGFRGFGTIDLGRLALAERRWPAPVAAAAGEARPDAEPAPGSPAGLAEAAAPEPTVPEAVSPEAVAAEAGEAVAPLPSEPASTADTGPRVEAKPPANVVQLRAFQGSASGRFGAVPVPPAAPTAEAAAEEPQPETPAALPTAADEAAPEPEDGPLSDQLAFLALGEALRARIGAPAATEDPPGAAGAAALPPSAAAEPASPLLDRLPIAVLATVGDRAVFANPAAAARLGYAGPRALLDAGEAALVSTDAPDRIALRDAGGRAVTSAARRVEVSWAGAPATLWLLSEPAGDAPEAAGARPEAAGAGDERSTELLDRVDDAVALLDAAGRLRRLNRRGEGWFGRVEPEGAAARSLADLLAPESRPAALALLGEVRNGRDGRAAPPLRRDVVARTADDGAVPMLLTLGRLGVSGFYATLRDVSALLRAETDRARTARDHARVAGRLPDLLAKVSHEIRTPLGAILGFAEVMMDERFGPIGNPRYKDYLKDIHSSGAQVVALVDDLLDLSRIEAGQLDLAVAAVDVNRVVTEAVAQMQPEAHRERVIMRTSLAGRIPSVLADERSARQIVKNLLSNAVKFNEPGGQVIVSTALGEAGAVLLRVRDTGVGMSDEAIAAALEPFGGLPGRAPAGGGGMGNGLGLPLTRALVGANGASMTIRSRPREGTLVEVSFAAAEDGEARRPA